MWVSSKHRLASTLVTSAATSWRKGCAFHRVIIPTTGDILVREAIASVLAQTAPDVTPYIVVDGPGFLPAFEAATAGMDLSRCHVVTLPVNVGGGGFYGHRVYAAFSHLVNTELIAYLDQDNRFQPEHLAHLCAALTDGHWDWGFALRRVVAPSGEPLMDDESQSVGPGAQPNRIRWWTPTVIC